MASSDCMSAKARITMWRLVTGPSWSLPPVASTPRSPRFTPSPGPCGSGAAEHPGAHERQARRVVRAVQDAPTAPDLTDGRAPSGGWDGDSGRWLLRCGPLDQHPKGPTWTYA